MIHIDRSVVPRPAFFDRPDITGWWETHRGQENPPTPNLDSETYRALHALFHSKCAICESPMTRVLPWRWRPPYSSLGLDGVAAPEHYGWLRYAWDNLYLVCGPCAQSQGTRFPVGADRADVGATGPALREEQPLLLDPCSPVAEDWPELHLRYDERGRVLGGTEQGVTTVEVYGLNREALIQARQQAQLKLGEQWDRYVGSDDEEVSKKSERESPRRSHT